MGGFCRATLRGGEVREDALGGEGTGGGMCDAIDRRCWADIVDAGGIVRVGVVADR